MKLLLSIIIFLLSISQTNAQFWKALNGVYGGAQYEIINHTATGALVTINNGGIFRSTDSGATWTRSSSGIVSTDIAVRGLTQDGSGKLYCNSLSRVYSSTDGGVTWTQTTTVTNSFGSVIKVSPVNGNIFISHSSGSQILRSSDGGQTFNATTFSASFISDMEVNSLGHIIVAVQGQSALYITTNNGTNWSPMSSGSYTGFPTLSVSQTYKIAIDNSNNLYVLTDVAPYRLASGATAWTSIKGTLTETMYYGNIFASGSAVYLTNNSISKLFTYNGSTWNAGVAYPYAGMDITSFFPMSSTEFYMGVISLGIYKSTNSGSVWTASSAGLKGFNYSDLHLTSNGRLFAAWSNLGYLVSLDDGQTWDLNIAGNTNRSLTGFVTLSDNSILGYGSGAIRSTDNGNNWTLQNANQFLTQVVVNGTSLFSFSGSNLLKSVDAGVTWTSTAISGLPSPIKMQVDASNNSYFLASGSIYKVNSGATTATVVSGVSSVRDLVFVNNTLIALAGNGTAIAKSVDGGTNWTPQPISSTNAAFKLWAYNSNVLLTQGNSVATSFLSVDGGATWTSNPLLDSFGTLMDVVFRLVGQTDVYAYAAVNNSVVHKSVNEIVLPAAPTNLQMITNAYNAIEFIWNDNSDNEDNYVIEVSEGGNSSYSTYRTVSRFGTNVGYTTNQGYGSVSAKPTTTYFIRVYAKNGAGGSAYSNEISVTTINQCNTTIPDNRSWTATTVAAPGYTPFGSGPYTNNSILIRATSNSTNLLTVSRYVLGIIDPSIHGDEAMTLGESCGQAYMYSSNDDINNVNGTWNPITKTIVIKWRTFSSYDDFQATTTYVLNPTDPIPATPSFTLYTFSSTEVLLNWNQPGFETKYVIQRATVSGGPYTDITVDYPKTSYVDKSLLTGTQYFYRIKALNATGSSAYSAEQTITLTSSHLFKPMENSLNLNFENQQGASWADLDGDGDEDIASPSFVNNAGLNVPPVFYENIGGGQFNRRSLSILDNDNDAISRGINVVDFNNDGKLDMYITRSGVNVADLLLINNGNWNFTRTALSSTALYSNSFRGSAAADYDKDGLVDVYVGNDGGSSVATNPGFLLKNTTGSAFTTQTNGSLATDVLNARLSAWADYDNDGDQDIYVINNTSPASAHRLYKNNGDGTFNKLTGTIFDTDLFNNARTISWGDIDNDGDLDLYVGISVANVNPIFNDRLYRNDGNGVFTSLTTSPVAENGTPTFGSSFGDIDNDGDLDLLVINATANAIFINNGAGTFTKSASQELFTNPSTFEIGGAMADFDGDGFLDIYPAKGNTTLIDLPNFLYKNNSTPSSSKNWIEIRLQGTTSNRAAIGARIKVVTTTPARTQIREISSRTGYGSQNSLIQHFGLGTATAISQIEIKWPSGATQIIINVTQLNKVITIVEDLTPPTFTFNPAHNSTNVVVGNKLEITLSEPATAVAAKNLVIRKGSSSATPLQTIAVTAAVIDANNKATFTLAANVEYLTQYFVSLDAGAFIDAYQNASLAVAPTEWTFTTEEQPDVTPPTITFTPPATLEKNFGGGQKLEVIAADNKAVSTVTMFYRKITEVNFKSLPGTFNASTSKYDFPLAEAYFDDMGMEYYFEAKDAKPNTTRNPVGASFHLTRLTFSESIKAISIAPSASATGYKIISMPYDLDTYQVGIIFDELGAPDPKEWRLLKYLHTPQSWIEGFQNVARGEGYFIISKNAENVKFGTGTSPNYSQSNPFVLILKKGFNLIGNPYNVPISWSEIKTGITGVGDLKVYSGGTYTSGDILNEFEGGFVFSDADNISVPVKLKTTTGGRKSSNTIGTDLGNDDWIVSLTLSQGDQAFNFGGIGMSKTASLSYDDLDDFAPPSLLEKQEIKFAHPEHFMKNFARDVVPTQSEFEWVFHVDTEITLDAELKWDNTSFGNNANELYLLDVSRQVIIDMRTESQYLLDPSKSLTFKIYFGQDLKSKLKPDGVFLGNAFPNPSNKLINIPFTVSGSDNYLVRLEVYDMMGKKVTTLVDKELQSGYHSTTWDVEQTNSSNGLYTYRLLVNGNNKSEAYTNKVIVNK